jgi:hypothetical protein
LREERKTLERRGAGKEGAGAVVDKESKSAGEKESSEVNQDFRTPEIKKSYK